jgi:cytochrome c-type biogenesis protein CcmH/NrfG
MAAAQDAHPDEARRYWTRLLTKLPAGSEDAQMIKSALDTLSGERSGSEGKPGSGGQPGSEGKPASGG